MRSIHKSKKAISHHFLILSFLFPSLPDPHLYRYPQSYLQLFIKGNKENLILKQSSS